MMKKYLLLLLVLLLPFTMAGIWWPMEGYPNTYVTDLAYSSSDNNQVDIQRLSCVATTSKFTPVARDLDNDGVIEFVMTTTTGLSIVSPNNCVVKYTIDVGEGIYSPPVLFYVDDAEQTYYYIGVLTNSALYTYQYDATINGFSEIEHITYEGQAMQGGLVCPYNLVATITAPYNNMCIGFDNNTLSTTIFNLDTNTAVNSTSGLGITTGNNRGLSYKRHPADATDILIPKCGRSVSDIWYRLGCSILNISGNKTSFAFQSDANLGNALSSVQWESTFISTFGGSTYIFSAGRYTITAIGTRYLAIISDMAGVSQFEIFLTTPISYWGIGKYNLQDQYACIIVNDTGKSYLNCYDAAWTLGYNISFTSLINSTESFIMADFNGTEDTLGIATSEGIFYPTYQYNHSGYSYAASHTGSMMTVSQLTYVNNYTKVPYAAYSDGSYTWIMYSPTYTAALCGNRVQDAGEDEFSCPEDFPAYGLTNGTCLIDDDCPVNYPTCLANRCVAGYNASNTCTFDRDCPYYAPICFLTYCVSGVSGNYSISAGTENQQQIDSSINATLGILFGTSTLLKFIIGICIILAIVMMIAQQLPGSPIAVIFGGAMATVLVTVLGLIPVYVLILIIIIGLLILLLSKAIFPSGGG